MTSVEPGKQYLGIVCRKCGKPSPYVEVEEGTQLGATTGQWEIACVHCGHKAWYPVSELQMMKTHLKQ
jgi:hypothetical protein